MQRKIILGLVSFSGVKPATLIEVLNLFATGLVNSVNIICGSLLPAARNMLVRDVYKNHPDFTHILFLDDDMVDVSTGVVEELIKINTDIIAPVMTQRAPPFNICASYNTSATFNSHPIEVDGVGFGLCLVRREVFESLGENTSSGPHWFIADREPRNGLQDEINVDLSGLENVSCEDPMKEAYIRGLKRGLTAHIGTDPIGEDILFCKKAKRNGFKVMLHTGLTINHIGEYAYGIDNFAEYQKKMQQGALSIGAVSEENLK